MINAGLDAWLTPIERGHSDILGLPGPGLERETDSVCVFRPGSQPEQLGPGC